MMVLKGFPRTESVHSQSLAFMETFTNASAIILTGGQILRMGTAKFQLDFAGGPLMIARIDWIVGSLTL